jgi:hypothetical protein
VKRRTTHDMRGWSFSHVRIDDGHLEVVFHRGAVRRVLRLNDYQLKQLLECLRNALDCQVRRSNAILAAMSGGGA